MTALSPSDRTAVSESERSGLASLYQTLREKDISHEEAFRSLLARVLMSPSFLLHLELSELAATGRLHQPEVLAEQTARMLKDDRARALSRYAKVL